jgi:glycerol-3-phosphate dehydrogenase
VTSTALNAQRRTADLTALADGAPTDVVVIGGGITGVGIALDAAARGLRVTLVEKHDLAFGTSRWSSKLVHGGLRYLATGNVGIARRSAVERGILMQCPTSGPGDAAIGSAAAVDEPDQPGTGSRRVPGR